MFEFFAWKITEMTIDYPDLKFKWLSMHFYAMKYLISIDNFFSHYDYLLLFKRSIFFKYDNNDND